MTPLRKKILALARKYDGALMTMNQLMDFKSTMNSMDDTLTDKEVWSLLSRFHETKGAPPEFCFPPLKPNNRLVKVSVAPDGKVTSSPSPFSES